MAACGGACACSNTTAVPPVHPAKQNIVDDVTKGNVLDVIEDEDLRKLLNDYFFNDVSENLEKHQKDIFHSYKSVYVNNTLVRIVETLAFALTNTNVEKRAKGTGLLAECIFQCSPGTMVELEVDTLMRFFCDRLKDHHSIQPIVIYAFLGLLSYQNVKNDLIISMLQSIFAEVHIQSLLQADRRNVFNIFSNLLKTKSHILKPFSSEFVFGYIQSMDGERDPRNLLLCFENSLLVIRDLDISLFAEDLFEILSCYFPVEFREPKEDEFRIKKVDLVTSLRKCLSASKYFGPFAIPLYLEKLSSDLIESKLDALITFSDCLQTYNPEDIALHIDDIWLAIRKDYLLSDFAELSRPYLDFIYKLVKRLSNFNDVDPIMKMVGYLIKDCLQTLKDPEMTIAIPCGNVILQASNASQIVCNEILNKLLSPLQSTLEKYTSIPQRTSTMEIVTKIFSVDNENVSENILLTQFVDYLLPLLYDMFSNCQDIKLQVLCLRCCKHILSKSSSFQHCDFTILTHHCLCPLQERTLPSNLLSEYKPFLEILSQQFPKIFKSRYLEFLKNNLVDEVEKDVVSQCFDLLPCTSFENEELVQDIYGYFANFLTLVVKDTKLGYCEDVLQCYINVLRKSKGRTIEGNLFILPLINIIESLACDLSDKLLVTVCCTLSESFKLLSKDQNKELLTFVCNFLTNEENVSGNPNLDLFDYPTVISSLDNNSRKFSILLRGVLTQVKPSDLHGVVDANSICNGLLHIMKRTVDTTALENLCILFGSIINKVSPESTLSKMYIDIIRDLINGDNPCNYAIIMLPWVTKGLVLNWQSSTTIAIDTMLACLRKEALASICVTGFDIIVKNIDYVFTKESNIVIKPAYKQRYTEYILPLLIEQYNNGEEVEKSFHMVAISSTLQAIPKQMLKKHLKSMMPLLMHSLATSNNPQITESTLVTILSVLGENKDDVIDYVPSVLARLLNLVTNTTMNIRILSLKSLAILSSCASHVVQPMKTDVIKKVRLVLDDPKRLVRKEAIRCSNTWYLMAGGEV